MIDSFEQIWWEGSWLLGWQKTSTSLTLFVELHLRAAHPAFEPYDAEKFFGCYKTARLVVSGLQSVTGLPSSRHDLQWNEVMEEFKDVGDIDVFNVDKGGAKLMMEVGAASRSDCFVLEAEGGSINLIFEDFYQR